MKKYIGGLLKLAASGLLLYTIYVQNKTIQKYKMGEGLQGGDIVKAQTIDSLTNVIDSLQSEAFSASNAVGRYELSLQHIEETHPAAAKEFVKFLQNETE